MTSKKAGRQVTTTKTQDVETTSVEGVDFSIDSSPDPIKVDGMPPEQCPCGKPIPVTAAMKVRARARSGPGAKARLSCSSCGRYWSVTFEAVKTEDREAEARKKARRDAEDAREQLKFDEGLTGRFNQATVILTVTLAKLGGTALAEDEEVTVQATEGEDPDRDALDVYKDLFKREPTYREVGSIQGRIRSYARAFSLKSGGILSPGSYLVPIKAVEKIYEGLDRLGKGLSVAIDQFVEEYPAIQERARGRLKGSYNEKDWPPPEALRAHFLVRGEPVRKKIRLMGSVPSEGLSASLVKDELKAAEREVQAMVSEVRDGLRESFAKLVQDLAGKLEETGTGEKKRFKLGPKIEQVKEFLDSFGLKNVTEDAQLKGLVEKAKKVLEGVDADQIRARATVKEAVKTQLGEISKTLGSMVELAPKRKVRVAD